MPVPDQTKNEARRDYLLDVASQFFLEKGFEATSVGEIAREAHASKETFYRYFPTKEDLFRGVVQRSTARMATELNLVLAAHTSPEEALFSFGMILLERALAADMVRLHTIMGMSTKLFPELAKIFYEQGPVRVQATLAAYLKEQRRRGKLRKTDPNIAARQFIDLVMAEQMFRSKLGIFPKTTLEDRRVTVRAAIDCFLNGYLERTGRAQESLPRRVKGSRSENPTRKSK